MTGGFGVRGTVDLELIAFLWQECAAIGEFHGRLSREDAEQLARYETAHILAYSELVPRWVRAQSGQANSEQSRLLQAARLSLMR